MENNSNSEKSKNRFSYIGHRIDYIGHRIDYIEHRISYMKEYGRNVNEIEGFVSEIDGFFSELYGIKSETCVYVNEWCKAEYKDLRDEFNKKLKYFYSIEWEDRWERINSDFLSCKNQELIDKWLSFKNRMKVFYKELPFCTMAVIYNNTQKVKTEQKPVNTFSEKPQSRTSVALKPQTVIKTEEEKNFEAYCKKYNEKKRKVEELKKELKVCVSTSKKRELKKDLKKAEKELSVIGEELYKAKKLKDKATSEVWRKKDELVEMRNKTKLQNKSLQDTKKMARKAKQDAKKTSRLDKMSEKERDKCEKKKEQEILIKAEVSKRKGKYDYKLKNKQTTDNEERYANIFRRLLSNKYELRPQVSLRSIIEKVGEFDNIYELNKDVDFCVFDKEGKPKLVIEINDSSHDTEKRLRRDKFVKNLCEKVDLDFVAFRSKKKINEKWIEKELKIYLDI